MLVDTDSGAPFLDLRAQSLYLEARRRAHRVPGVPSVALHQGAARLVIAAALDAEVVPAQRALQLSEHRCVHHV